MENEAEKRARKLWLTYFFAAVIAQTIGWGIIVYQVFLWLRNGVWKSISLEGFLQSMDLLPSYSWYNYPDSWVGANTALVFVLQKTPLSAFLIILSSLVAAHFGLKHDRSFKS